MTMRHSLLPLVIVLIASFGGSAIAANLVLNPGFETGDFTDWTVTGDGVSIDTVFPNTGCCDAAFSATTTDTNAGVLSQTLSTLGGKTYKLSFAVLDEAGFSGDSFFVQFGGFSATITGDMAGPPGDLPSLYTAETFTVPGTDIVDGSTALAFKGLSDPVSGINWNLDDASVTAVATPEPSTWALLVIAFTGLGIQRRLKHWRPRSRMSLIGPRTSRPRPAADPSR
jgi:hypothetical protein